MGDDFLKEIQSCKISYFLFYLHGPSELMCKMKMKKYDRKKIDRQETTELPRPNFQELTSTPVAGVGVHQSGQLILEVGG